MEQSSAPLVPAHSPKNETESVVSQKQIIIIVVATLVVTALLLFGINTLFSKNTTTPSQELTDTPTAMPSATPDSIMDTEPSVSPTVLPSPTVKPTTSPTPKPSITPSPTASASAKPSTTVTITTVGGQDGWVDNTATTSANTDIKVGRTSSTTIRGLVGFDIGSVTKSSTVTKAVLRLYQTSVVGNPYGNIGTITVDHLDFGSTVSSDDYSSSALASGIGTLSSTGTTEWKEVDVTSRVADDLSKHTSSQFRLRFTNETTGGDDSALFSGPTGSNPPQLVITYN